MEIKMSSTQILPLLNAAPPGTISVTRRPSGHVAKPTPRAFSVLGGVYGSPQGLGLRSGAQLVSSGQGHTGDRGGRALGASVTAALPAQHSLSASSRHASSTRFVRHPGQRRPDGERCPAGLDPVDALAAGPFKWPCLRISPYAVSILSRGSAAIFVVRAVNGQSTRCSCAHGTSRGRRHHLVAGSARLHGAGGTPRESHCSSALFLRLTYARCGHRFLASSEEAKTLSVRFMSVVAA